MHVDKAPSNPPPGVWPKAHRLATRVIAPVESFLHIEAASGILLLVAAAIALVWANSPWHEGYAALWHTRLGLSFAGFGFERDLHFWVNDGLMTIFFFVVGLEIRREIHAGELSELRRAALPLAAALGGMLVPAAIYAALNHGHAGAGGWGVPMATDIAFAVGVLALLGKRVPPALRVLLLALAVIDDVGAILVIALFYSTGINTLGLAVAILGIAVLVVLQRFGVRSGVAYWIPGLVIWGGTYASGIHPTLAGVALGLLTPVHAWEGREEVSPATHWEKALHAPVAFVVMPLFALANAGVSVAGVSLGGDSGRILFGVAAGLVLGKLIGVVGAARLTTALGIALLPRGVTWKGVTVVGLVAGIGFTMSIFVAHLAFPLGTNLETAKLAVLIGSATAAVLGLAYGRAALGHARPESGMALTAAEAEASTEA